MPKLYYLSIIQKLPELNIIKECLICLVEFTNTDVTRLTVCMHIFHDECLV